ncbi:unnamed protein product [Euphydryas editha]|uniref:Uncharacterized protein n=1 Tax=Euphydryas editha TaxID=104508 RepID=A0AAU9UC74_EUPED|nr:unnamed protein product [Euphydryas editha]
MNDHECNVYSDEVQLKLNILKKKRELLAMIDQDNNESSCSDCTGIKCTHVCKAAIANNYISRVNYKQFKAPPASFLPKPKWRETDDEGSVKSSISDRKDPYQNVAWLNSYQIDTHDESIAKGKSLLSLMGVIPPSGKNLINEEELMAMKTSLFPRNGVIPPIGKRCINGVASISKETAHVLYHKAIPSNHKNINDERTIAKDKSMFKWIDESYLIASEISSSSLFSYNPNSDDTQTATTASGINKITKHYTLF